MRLAELYGGRHLRTTLVLALTSAAAGGLTGAVAFGVSGTPVGHEQPAPGTHRPAPKHRHPATTAPVSVWHPNVAPSHSTSPTPKATGRSTTVKTAPPAASASPPAPTSSSAPTSAAPSGSPSAPADAASPPG